MERLSKIMFWAGLVAFVLIWSYCWTFLAHGSCFWYTKLEAQKATRYARLISQPEIGQLFHFNGQIWRVTETRRGCK